jgi:hypothetical protein
MATIDVAGVYTAARQLQAEAASLRAVESERAVRFSVGGRLTNRTPKRKRHMDAAIPFNSAHARPATGVLSTWLVDAWRLFRRAPLRMFLLSLLPLVVEALIQLVPEAGVVASKLLTPLASAWVLALVHHKARDGIFAPARASSVWVSRLVSLLAVALASATVFAFQLLVATALGSVEQAFALASGDFGKLAFGRVELALILASGMLPGSLLMFLMPRVLLDGKGVGTALGESVSCVLRYWRPVAIISLLMAGMAAASLWSPAVLLVFVPLFTLIGYSSYRDVFDRRRAD